MNANESAILDDDCVNRDCHLLYRDGDRADCDCRDCQKVIKTVNRVEEKVEPLIDEGQCDRRAGQTNFSAV